MEEKTHLIKGRKNVVCKLYFGNGGCTSYSQTFNKNTMYYLLYSSNNSNKKKFALYVKLLCFVIYVKYVKLFIKKLAQKCLNIKKFNTIFNAVWYNPERSVIGTALSQNI